MTIIVVIALAILTLTLFYVTFRSRGKQVEARPLDLAAFYTVMDREDEIFLQQRLPRREFFRLKRQRIGVIWKYVKRMSDNSGVVMRVAGMARQDPDPKVAEAALQVVNQATQLRTLCLIAFSKLAMEFMVPSMQLTPAVLAPKYESLRQNLVRLGALHPREAIPLPSAI